MDRILIECIPNFSEGRDPETVEKIANAIRGTAGVDLLDVDIGKSANRTVMTFVGGPSQVVEAAFRAISMAAQLIDMRLHRGTHPRVGATDVCPFVPLMGANMEDCIRMSEQLASRVAAELDIPVYLYGQSARSKDRSKLSYIRRGQYEQLAKRITEDNFWPDYGPKALHERAGATVVGARQLLVAYNINLDSQSASVARAIAAQIRQMRISGAEAMADCAAIGWYTEEYNCAQVSMNLMNLRTTSLHQTFLTAVKLAENLGTTVAKSEVIGLVPLKALLDTGRYFWHCLERTRQPDEKQLIDTATDALKLCQSQQERFEPEKKIIEYRLKNLGYGINKGGFAL